MARAIWKGVLLIGEREAPIKLYSAIEDRNIHFRLLHAQDLAPVEQHVVRKDTGDEVASDERRKAFPLDTHTAVILQREDLEQLEPPASREIHLCRFVPRALLSDQWFDRPYYVGPDEDEDSYFALTEALSRKDVIGVARWVMRKKRYLGALSVHDGYLTMITLRRADQVLSFSGVQPAKTALPQESELKLAEQLVASITGDFEPQLWPDEYRKRLCELIEAKARGARLAAPKPKRTRAEGDLGAMLRASIAAAKERRVA